MIWPISFGLDRMIFYHMAFIKTRKYCFENLSIFYRWTLSQTTSLYSIENRWTLWWNKNDVKLQSVQSDNWTRDPFGFGILIVLTRILGIWNYSLWTYHKFRSYDMTHIIWVTWYGLKSNLSIRSQATVAA